MAAERRLSAEAKPFAPPTPLAKVVSRDDDEPPRRRGVIVDNLKVSYGFVRLDDDAAAQDLCLHLTDCAYAQRAPRPAAPVITMRRRIFRALATGRPGLSPSLEGGLAAHIALLYKLYASD